MSGMVRHASAVVAGLAAIAIGGAAPACKTSTPSPAASTAAGPAPTTTPATLDQKVAWILRLEQSRELRDPPGRASAAAPAPPGQFVAARAPDLAQLVRDPDAGVRSRAALAIGRVNRPESVALLTTAIADPGDLVRAEAAFALGLTGAPAATAPLEHALDDPSPLVRARAIEGLGLVGDTTAAPAVLKAATGCSTVLAPLAPDDDEWPKTPEIELCRSALEAFVRLKSYDGLTHVAFDEHGQLATRWWPVAFAFQRIADPRAADVLVDLAGTSGVYTASFAMRGLAALHDRRVVPIAKTFAERVATDVRLRVTAVRALGDLGGADADSALLAIVRDQTTPKDLLIEAVTALGRAKTHGAFDLLLDLAGDRWTALRVAALTAAARVDPDGFLLVAPSFATDSQWSVRAALAGILAGCPPDRVRGALEDLTTDADARVRGPALEALAKVGAPDLAERLFTALDAPDFVVRADAARLLGTTRPEGGAARLVTAYTRGTSDATYVARVAALEGLAAYGAAAATPTLHEALDDKDWPVRTRAADLLHGLGEHDAQPTLPAPLRQPPTYFESAGLLHPTYSPHALIDVPGGTIEIELNVVDAPLTSASFIALARAGFFNGIAFHRVVPDFVVQTGDPRGDGEGGPGYSIRDELSPIPFVRGTVGMALDFPETGGSQFFITLSPQPHLDAKYTVFGRVVRGAELLDGLAQGDVVTRVRIWDGTSFE